MEAKYHFGINYSRVLNYEGKIYEPSKLKIPIEILADFLKNCAANLRKCHLTSLLLGKTS